MVCSVLPQTGFRQGPQVLVTTHENKLDGHETKTLQKGFRVEKILKFAFSTVTLGFLPAH